jgi:hypothetical protein
MAGVASFLAHLLEHQVVDLSAINPLLASILQWFQKNESHSPVHAIVRFSLYTALLRLIAYTTGLNRFKVRMLMYAIPVRSAVMLTCYPAPI